MVSCGARCAEQGAGRGFEQGSLDETDDTAIDALSKIRNRGNKPGSPGRRRSA